MLRSGVRSSALGLWLSFVACGDSGGGGGSSAASQPVTIAATVSEPAGRSSILIDITAHVMADVTLVEPKLAPAHSVVKRLGDGKFSLEIPLQALPAAAATTFKLRAQRPGQPAASGAETSVTFTRRAGCTATRPSGTKNSHLLVAIECEGIAGTGGVRRPKDGKISIDVTFPPGSAFTYDGKTATPPDGKFAASIDLWPIARALTPEQVQLREGRVDGKQTWLDYPLTVVSGGQSYDLAFQLPVSDFAGAAILMFEQAAQGKPGLFPGETPPPSGTPARSIWQSLSLRGPAKRADEVDLVAVTRSSVRSISCGAFASAGGAKATVKAEMTDVTASVFDRRTGKRLGQQTFRAPQATCPDSISGAGGKMAVGTGADEAAVQAWIDSFVK